MRTRLDCLPCFVRQTLDAARRVSDDPEFHEQAVRDLFRDLAEADWLQSPPVLAQRFHRRLRARAGVTDPYAEQKRRHNELALRLLPALRRAVEQSDDPLVSAAKFAIAGNVIDLGAKSGLDETEVLHAIEHAAEQPLEGAVETFRAAVAAADGILYLADNAGEIVLDRLLIEQLGAERVVLAVRGAPILNDALEEDARRAGLHDIVRVIGNGTDVPGTDLAQCSAEFRTAFDAADLIISKGQGNFETLSEADRPIFFLLRAKCPVVAEVVGRPLGSHVLTETPAA